MLLLMVTKFIFMLIFESNEFILCSYLLPRKYEQEIQKHHRLQQVNCLPVFFVLTFFEEDEEDKIKKM